MGKPCWVGWGKTAPRPGRHGSVDRQPAARREGSPRCPLPWLSGLQDRRWTNSRCAGQAVLLELAVLLRKQVNHLKEGALGNGDKSIRKPIFIISLMIVLKLWDRDGRVGVTQVLINGLRGRKEWRGVWELAKKVYKMRPLASRRRDRCRGDSFAGFKELPWPFPHLAQSLCSAFDPLRNLELIISMTLRLVWVFMLVCLLVCFRINLALIYFIPVYEYMLIITQCIKEQRRNPTTPRKLIILLTRQIFFSFALRKSFFH